MRKNTAGALAHGQARQCRFVRSGTDADEKLRRAPGAIGVHRVLRTENVANTLRW